MTCAVQNCQFQPHDATGLCLLHCEKSANNTDENLIREFYAAFAFYLANEIAQLKGPATELDIQNSLQDNITEGQEVKNATQKIGRYKPILIGIHFPNIDLYDGEPDFRVIFRRFTSIDFEDCTIHFSYADYHRKIEASYTNCTFKTEFNITEQKAYGHYGLSGSVYSNCVFEEVVNIRPMRDIVAEIPNNQFSDCRFCCKLHVERVVLKGMLINNSDRSEKIVAKTVELWNAELSENTYFNNFLIDRFDCKQCTFSRKFELKDSEAKSFDIHNSLFEIIVDFYKSKFGNFSLYKCVFNRFVGFEDCEFGLFIENARAANFSYTTFLEFTNFRGAQFFEGLDLMNTNMGSIPNFLGVHCDFEKTNRETFRIIKDSFDKSGNKIEANTFFAKEMRKYRDELSTQKERAGEKLILNLNLLISDFGQSYLRPVLWILFFGILNLIFRVGYAENWLYSIPSLSPVIRDISHAVNEFAISIIPFGRFLTEGMEFISLIFYVIFSALLWQTIVAIKRITRR